MAVTSSRDEDEAEMSRHFNMDFGSMPMHFLAQGDEPPVIMIPETAGAGHLDLLDAVDGGGLDEDGVDGAAHQRYPCTMCSYATDNPRPFLVHMRSVHHERMQIYECPHCTYASRHSQKMTRHVSMVHDPDRQGRRKPGPPPRPRDHYYDDFVREMLKRQRARVFRKQQQLILQQEHNVAAAARAVAAAARGEAAAPGRMRGRAEPPTATITLRDLELQRQREIEEQQRRQRQQRNAASEDDDEDDDDDGKLIIDNDDEPPPHLASVDIKQERDDEEDEEDAEDADDRSTPPSLQPQRTGTRGSRSPAHRRPSPAALLLRVGDDAADGVLGAPPSSSEPLEPLEPLEPAGLFKCSSCDFTSRTASLVTRHESVVHLKRRFYRCTRCTYVTPLRARFERHSRCHSLPVVKCEECDFQTPYRWNLDRHLRNHNAAARKRYACGACSFSTDIRQTLTVHGAHHHVPPVPTGALSRKRRGARGASTQSSAVAAVVASASSAAAAVNGTRDVCRQNVWSEEARRRREVYRMRNDTAHDQQADGAFAPIGAPVAANNGHADTSGPADGDSDSDGADAPAPSPEDIPSAAAAFSASSASGAVPGVRLPHHQALRCSLCDFRTPFFADMSRHMSGVHGGSGGTKRSGPPTLTPGPQAPKRPAKPLPNLIPIQTASSSSSPSSARPAASPPRANGANGEESQEAAKKKNTFFDQLRLYPGTTPGDGSELVCVHCGHEAKTPSELVRHNKLHQGSSRGLGTSTRCQHCRHRCKTSADLVQHLQTCAKAAAATAAPPAANDPAKPVDGFLDDSTRLTTDSEMEYDIASAAEASADGFPTAMEDAADGEEPDHVADDSIPVADAALVGVETAPGYGLVTNLSDLEARAAKEKIPTPRLITKKVFKCQHCPFWAATASRFHVHIVGHLNKKPFACSICKYRSNWRWDITKHIRVKQERDPTHSDAKILMTDETGRKNYSKYNKSLIWLKCAEPQSEGAAHLTIQCMYSSQGNMADSDAVSVLQVLPAPPKLTRAPVPRSAIQAAPSSLGALLRPPPPLQAASLQTASQISGPQQQQQAPQSLKRPADTPVPNVGSDPKKSNTDIKKTVWRCKQCHFRDGDRAVVLSHVKGHYRQQQEAAMAKLKNASGAQSQNIAPNSKSGIKKVPFRCDICPFVSISDSVMQGHMNCHKERSDVLFKCFYCPFYVSTKAEMVQHMAVHKQNTKPDDYSSLPDKASAPIKVSAQPQQTIQSPGDVQIKKEIQEQDFTSSANQGNRSVNRSLGPPSLDFSNMSEAPVCWVLRDEKLQKMLRCRFCPHTNQRRANMIEHEKMHSKRGDVGESSGQYSPYPCSDCSYVCNNAGVLSTHMKVHLSKNSQAYAFYDPYRSEALQIKEIASKYGLKLKMEKPPQKSPPPKEAINVGNENKLNGIDVMSLLDPNQSLTDAVLAMNKKLNMELDGEPFAEPVEDLGESSPCSPLKQLIDPTASNVPEEKELHFCHLCPARFLFRKELGIHSRFHNLHLVHKCDNCTYTSRQKNHMDGHVKVHTEDYQNRTNELIKLYKVNKDFPMPRIVCVNLKAGVPGNLWIVIETPESPPPAPKFLCPKCPASFFKNEAYQAHLTLHGSNNQHKCPICDYAVKTYGNLIKHMITHGCRASVAKKITLGRMEVPESLRPKNAVQQQLQQKQQQQHTNKNEIPVQLTVPKEEPQSSENVGNVEIMENTLGEALSHNGVENMEIPSSTDIEVKEDLNLDERSIQDTTNEQKSDTDVKDKENSPHPISPAKTSVFGSGSPEFVYPTFCRNGRVKVKKYKCEKCPSAFEKRDQYLVHKNLHGSKQRYKCTKCDYSVKFFANHIQHLRRHKMSEEARNNVYKDDSESSTNEGEETSPEDSENIRSLSPIYPTRSAKTTGGKGEKLSVADQQAIMVLQQRRAKRAAISRESLDKNYWCSHCPYCSPRRDQVESHMKRHFAMSGVRNTFACDHCDYSVPNKHFLRDHVKVHFDISKAPKPDAYMICDSIELYASSGFLGKGKSKGKILIFQDKGVNAVSDRFLPPLRLEASEDSSDVANKYYINLKTFESESFSVNGNKDNVENLGDTNSECEREADCQLSETSSGEPCVKYSDKVAPDSSSNTDCGVLDDDLTRVEGSDPVVAADS